MSSSDMNQFSTRIPSSLSPSASNGTKSEVFSVTTVRSLAPAIAAICPSAKGAGRAHLREKGRHDVRRSPVPNRAPHGYVNPDEEADQKEAEQNHPCGAAHRTLLSERSPLDYRYAPATAGVLSAETFGPESEAEPVEAPP